MKYVCPFCYKIKPQSAEPAAWACCGETGHAIVLPACPKCNAEFFDPAKSCEVCGYSAEENAKLRAENKRLREALRGMVSISRSVTMAQERERLAKYQPQAEALLRELGEV